uniref:hypothetical protein n=1 Tax=Paenibacillus terrae TaxID=159743 RepID=UPI001643F003|nr:hypothetical protein [Paenibacillus terrae]
MYVQKLKRKYVQRLERWTPEKGKIGCKTTEVYLFKRPFDPLCSSKKENAVISSRIHADGIGGDYYSEQASRNSNEAQKQYAQGQLLADCR